MPSFYFLVHVIRIQEKGTGKGRIEEIHEVLLFTHVSLNMIQREGQKQTKVKSKVNTGNSKFQ